MNTHSGVARQPVKSKWASFPYRLTRVTGHYLQPNVLVVEVAHRWFSSCIAVLARMKDVTLISQRIHDGQAGGSEDLFPAVYNELCRLAAAKMSFQRPDLTISYTAVVHEAYTQ